MGCLKINKQTTESQLKIAHKASREDKCEQGWYSVDPLVEETMTPYQYVNQNPIRYNDPTGMEGETTIVGDNRDGTYVVKDWVDDGSTDVVLEDGSKVGESLTTHSFVDSENNPVIGAVIDTKSTEGQDFIDNEIIADDPNLFLYAKNATINKKYDFKSRGLDKNSVEPEVSIHRTRGSMTSDGKMASARDFGNMAAGIVATRNGVSKAAARYKFNQLQGGQEPPVSAKAQEIGLNKGLEVGKQDIRRFQEWRRSIRSCRGCN